MLADFCLLNSGADRFGRQEGASDEIERLVKEEVLWPIDDGLSCSPIVPILKKDGSVMICCDYKLTINIYLKRNCFKEWLVVSAKMYLSHAAL